MTSIEFRLASSFTSPLFSTHKSSRRAGAAGVVSASVFLYVPERGFLFLGLTDGKILCWETERTATAPRGKDSPFRILDEHRGDIRCMIFVKDLCKGVMFTGAADRCIKMWDLSDPRQSIPCVHSLHGHGGTVLGLEYGSEMLVSSSTDGFLCIWRDQSPTKLLRFPPYSIRQKISPDAKGAAGGSRQPKETWFLSLSIREGEAPSVYAGDSEGYVHIYRPDPSSGDGPENQLLMLVWKKQIHELGVSRILTVPMESFLVTCAYDQKFKTLDSLGGQVIFEESDQSGVCFNSLAWDPVAQDVIVADEKGNIGFYNVYTESCVVWRNLTEEAILQVYFQPNIRRLLLLSPRALRVFDVVRGVKYSELNEHTGRVVGIASRSTSQGGLVYTAAMDNTIRLWDTDSLECIKCLKEKRHEITAMAHLPRANVIITGHENSDLKMWSLDCQMDACLRTVTGKSAHSNTISALLFASVAPAVDAADLADDAADATSAGVVDWEMLVAGSYDRQVSFWKATLTNDGTAMAKFDRAFVVHDAPDDEVLAVAYSAAASSLFTGGNSGVIRRWAFWGTKRLEAEYEGHEDAITCFAVDGHFLFSGSADSTVRIWETLQGYELKTVKMHSVTVQALFVIPETGMAASCAFDGRVVLWDPQVGSPEVKEVAAFEQSEEFCSVTYLEMSRTLLVGCESGKVVAFPLKVDGGLGAAGGAGAASASAAGAEHFAAQPKALSGVETPPSEDEDRSTLEALRLGGLKVG
uniref:Uncharacterized protein n=1 Tax=Zooxanthella nutricula TaxID=1333877 RepID=A0A6U6H4D5_9DINO|mmetsp:Transcript_104435/g.319841  ORF Transcript_104435/g.319841 Transcript_104435/m.319841 type:complete len:752 (+) Transcript_104435:61-2316(+)